MLCSTWTIRGSSSLERCSHYWSWRPACMLAQFGVRVEHLTGLHDMIVVMQQQHDRLL